MGICTSRCTNQVAFYNMKTCFFRDCIEVLKKDGEMDADDLSDEQMQYSTHKSVRFLWCDGLFLIRSGAYRIGTRNVFCYSSFQFGMAKGKGKGKGDDDSCGNCCCCICCVVLLPLIAFIVGLFILTAKNTRVERINEQSIWRFE